MLLPVKPFPSIGRIKAREELQTNLKEPSQQFSNLFNAYARAVNLGYQRSGALFKAFRAD
jgi:hypothetical protein